MVAGAVTWQANVTKPWPRDFGQVWYAARAVLRGADPYSLIGPGHAYAWAWPFLYPLPAAVAAVPLAPLSEAAACVTFSVIGGTLFAWALMEAGYGPLFGFFGASMHYAAETAQWSPLMSASFVLPALSFFLVCKPTVGLAYFAARPSRWALAGAVVLGGIALALQPTWIQSWLAAIGENAAHWPGAHPYRPPALYPGGALALLCLLRWRRSEARLVAVLACVPQMGALYETVPLFLVPRTFWQSATLVALSYVQTYVLAGRHLTEWTGVSEAGTQLSVLLLYLPVTLMVLLRPNVKDEPAIALGSQLVMFRARFVRRLQQRSTP
jgi:hypothetical protein